MNIFKFEAKRLLKSCLTWALVCGFTIALFMAFFPSMRDSGIQELVETKLGAFPEGLLEAFGINEMVDFTDIIQYEAYVLQYIGMATAIYGLILGVGSLLDEEKEGSIEFLYAQPVSRYEIVTYKALSRAIVYLVFMVIVAFATMVISMIYKPADLKTIEKLIDIKEIFIGLTLAGYIFLSIGLFLSTVLKPSYNSVAISIGVFFISYIFGVLSKMKDKLDYFRYLSPFDYAMPMNIVKEGWNWSFVALGLLTIMVSIIGTYMIYGKKDLWS